MTCSAVPSRNTGDSCEALRPELIGEFERACIPEAKQLVRACVAEAERRGAAIYLVGGALRDLLRDPPWEPHKGRRQLREIDLAGEGEIEELARAVARASGAELTLHRRFLTARLRLNATTMDLATARRERYPKAAALPVVQRSSIEEDLLRRDFTVNAMALRLTEGGVSGKRRGELLDPCRGLRDLGAGRIRVLHGRSFVDDPTRLLRACRYATRLEGRLGRETGRLMRRDAQALRRINRERLGAEWRRLLEDTGSEGALERAVRWGLTEAAVRGWQPAPRLLRAWTALGTLEHDGDTRTSEHFWALEGLVEDQAQAAARCALRREERRALESGHRLRARRRELEEKALPPSRAASILRGETKAAIESAAVLWPGHAGERARRYLHEWGGVESPLSAPELSVLGVRGAALGVWRSQLRDALLDGGLDRGLDGERDGALPEWRVKRAARDLVKRELSEKGRIDSSPSLKRAQRSENNRQKARGKRSGR